MRKLLLAVVMLVVCACNPAYAEDWFEIGYSEDQTSYIDLDSLRFGHGIGFWVKNVYKTSRKKNALAKGTAYSKVRYQAACEYNSLQAIEMYVYNSKDRIIKEVKGKADISLIPGSMSELYYNAACDLLAAKHKQEDETRDILRGVKKQ